jgi:lipid-A-disaccharide synthase
VVCYKGSPVSYFLAKRLVKVKYISLVNLVMDNKVVTELIQQDLNEVNLKRELEKILSEPTRGKMLEDYRRLWEKLEKGDASLQAAQSIVAFLSGADT